MKNVFFVIFGLVIIVFVGYFFWAAFIPMRIGEKKVEREVIQQSPQYVISQRSAILKIYPEYLKSEGGVKQALKSQMCEIANNIPADEWPNQIINLCKKL